MEKEKVQKLAEKFEVSEGVISTLYNEAKKDLAAESAQEAEQAAKQKSDMLHAADEAARAGNLQQSIALKRRAHGVQIGK